MNEFWIAILCAGAISYALRVLPFAAFRKRKLDSDHIIFEYLTYFAYAIMGCIIFDASFNVISLQHFVDHFSSLYAIKICALALAFILFFWTRKTLLSLAITVVIYAAALKFAVSYFGISL